MARHSEQFNCIQKAFQESDKPLSTTDALLLAQKEIKSIGIATVYRAIKRMLANNEITKIQLPEGILYEWQANCACHSEACEHLSERAHGHFTCCDCQQTTCLPPSATNFQLPKGYRFKKAHIVIEGICNACTKSERQA